MHFIILIITALFHSFINKVIIIVVIVIIIPQLQGRDEMLGQTRLCHGHGRSRLEVGDVHHQIPENNTIISRYNGLKPMSYYICLAISKLLKPPNSHHFRTILTILSLKIRSQYIHI